MLCENCGARVSESDTNCPVCGVKIERETIKKTASTKNLIIEGSSNNKRKIITICALSFVLLIAIIAIISLLMRGNNDIEISSNTTNNVYEGITTENDYNTNDTTNDGSSSGDNNFDGTTNANEDELNYTDSPTEENNQFINTYEIEKLPVATLNVDKIVSSSTNVEKSSKIVFNGNINSDGQKDEYSYTVSVDGRLRVELSEIKSGAYMGLYVINSLGETVDYDDYCYNGEGVTLTGLKSEEVYTIKVTQKNGYSGYVLSIHEQKQTIDASNYTIIEDSIEFTGQRNVYTFSPKISGRYRFDVSEVKSGVYFDLMIFDHLGELIAEDDYCYNGEGVTVKGLEAGQQYKIQVRHDNGYSGYKLNIGHQKETVDITTYSTISDSIQYVDQRNVYNFKVPIDGRYRFEVANLKSGMYVHLIVFNSLDETVAEDEYCYNGEGVTLKGLEAGQEYEVQVRYASGKGDYNISVGKQKEIIDIDLPCEIKDSIEYTDQRNVYVLKSDDENSIDINITGLSSGGYVQIYVFNELDETVVYDDYFYNNDTLSFYAEINEVYDIQIRQSKGYSSYLLTIAEDV